MLKQSSDYKQQIAKLTERGCIIPDKAFCENDSNKDDYNIIFRINRSR